MHLRRLLQKQTSERSRADRCVEVTRLVVALAAIDQEINALRVRSYGVRQVYLGQLVLLDAAVAQRAQIVDFGVGQARSQGVAEVANGDVVPASKCYKKSEAEGAPRTSSLKFEPAPAK